MLFLMGSCGRQKKSNSEIAITFTQDTLKVGYTYWWPESGPFVGSCGEELSLVFIGTVMEIKDPTDAAGPLYTAQEGIISLDKVLKIKKLNANTYRNQKFLLTDCFHDLALSVGDQVLVFCYDYEGEYSIPGNKSILKINGADDPLVKSIRTYIDAGQDPLKLTDDRGLWATVGLGRKLESIIKCRTELDALP
tara:strand:- start:3840 stop:4418 length:579 start_codon:yes stop_codon:yes gene_type:complete